MGRHILRRVIENLAEIAEGYLGHQPLRVVLIERAPAAVPGLHPQKPAPAPLQGPLLAPAVRQPGPGQADDHLSRVVRIRIEIVLELEGPASRFDALDLDLPISPGQHLLPQQPAAGLRHSRVVRRQARI